MCYPHTIHMERQGRKYTCGSPTACLGMETFLGLLKQPPPPVERLWCCPCGRGQLSYLSSRAGQGLLAFTRVLATNSLLCLFIWRCHGEVPKSTCLKEDWMFSLHSYEACAEASCARGRVGLCPADPCGLHTFLWRLLAHRGEDVCLHWDASVRWPRRAWYGQLALSWLEG